jgi:hypothetical protein
MYVNNLASNNKTSLLLILRINLKPASMDGALGSIRFVFARYVSTDLNIPTLELNRQEFAVTAMLLKCFTLIITVSSLFSSYTTKKKNRKKCF